MDASEFIPMVVEAGAVSRKGDEKNMKRKLIAGLIIAVGLVVVTFTLCPEVMHQDCYCYPAPSKDIWVCNNYQATKAHIERNIQAGAYEYIGARTAGIAHTTEDYVLIYFQIDPQAKYSAFYPDCVDQPCFRIYIPSLGATGWIGGQEGLEREDITITTYEKLWQAPPFEPIACDQPTPNFPSGCALLLHYDKDNDGKLNDSEVGDSHHDFLSANITNEEYEFIYRLYNLPLAYNYRGSINALCPKCLVAPTPRATPSPASISDFEIKYPIIAFFESGHIVSLYEDGTAYTRIPDEGTFYGEWVEEEKTSLKIKYRTGDMTWSRTVHFALFSNYDAIFDPEGGNILGYWREIR